MSASGPCNMRGPRLKTSLLLFLLLTTLTQTVLCDEDAETTVAAEEEPVDQEEVTDGDTETTALPDPASTSSPPDTPVADDEIGSGHPMNLDESTLDPSVSDPTSLPGDGEDEGLSPIIILIPVVLVIVIIGMIVCGIFINRRWNNKARDQELQKEDPYLDGPDAEKVPMPMFEEDVPSVLELEMEELGQWIKKDGDAAEDSKQA